MDYTEKILLQLDKIKSFALELNKKELKINNLNTIINEKRNYIDKIQKQIEKEEAKNFNLLNSVVSKEITENSKLTEDPLISKKIFLIKDIMILKNKELNSIQSKINKKINEFNNKFSSLSQSEQEIFNLLYREILNECKNEPDQPVKFSSQKIKRIYNEILDEKEEKILSSMNIDKFVGHKLTKLNISNVISDLLSNQYQTKNSLANIRFTPPYTRTKNNLKDGFIKIAKKNKIKDGLIEEKREKYHSRCMTYSATMQRRSKYRGKLQLKTSPSHRCLTKPVHINEIGGKGCCQKLYNNYKDNIEYYDSKKRALSENAKRVLMK